jgi:hypothetical protein
VDGGRGREGGGRRAGEAAAAAVARVGVCACACLSKCWLGRRACLMALFCQRPSDPALGKGNRIKKRKYNFADGPIWRPAAKIPPVPRAAAQPSAKPLTMVYHS